jgi:hypothetical protein
MNKNNECEISEFIYMIKKNMTMKAVYCHCSATLCCSTMLHIVGGQYVPYETSLYGPFNISVTRIMAIPMLRQLEGMSQDIQFSIMAFV